LLARGTLLAVYFSSEKPIEAHGVAIGNPGSFGPKSAIPFFLLRRRDKQTKAAAAGKISIVVDETAAQQTNAAPTGLPLPPGRGSFLRPHHHKGARRVTHHGFGHATEKRPLHSAATMTADDEEVC
jgi:hypothetical protein